MLSDAELLASLEHKLQLIRDRTQGVAEGYANGLYLWGEGGTSKSYTVEETLKRLGKSYKLTNSRITARGFFQLLRDFPDLVHVLEDIETVFADKISFGVIRSALWGQVGSNGHQERLVVWQTAWRREEFVFTGGIILVANAALDELPELRAVKTRIPSVHYHPTNDEIAALMRQIATEGHQHGQYRLSPDDCTEVANEVITRSQAAKRTLDLRLFVNSCRDRLQWENGAAAMHWLDLLESRLKETALPPREGVTSRKQQRDFEYDLVRRIAKLTPQERLTVWKRETKKSQAALYRRMDELKAAG